MHRSFFVVFLIGFLFFACVCKKQNLEPSSNLPDHQKCLEMKNKKLENLTYRLQRAEKNCKNCIENLDDLQVRLKNLENKNRQISHQIDHLELESEKKQSIIRLQEKVISLFDDSEKTIQSSLKELIEAQRIEIEQKNKKRNSF